MPKPLTYENQGRLSLLLAVAATLCAIAALVFCTLRRGGAGYVPNFGIVYHARSLRFFAFAGAIALAGICGAVSFLLAFNSMGHKRNKKSSLSWMGFWFSALALALTLSVLAAFMALKVSING